MANLNKQAKLQYFEKLNVDGNSKPFWKACFRASQIKIVIYKENTIMLKKDKFLSKQKNVA